MFEGRMPEEMEQSYQEGENEKGKNLYSSREVAEMLGKKLHTFDAWVERLVKAERMVAPFKKNGRYVFRESDVEQLQELHKEKRNGHKTDFLKEE